MFVVVGVFDVVDSDEKWSKVLFNKWRLSVSFDLFDRMELGT